MTKNFFRTAMKVVTKQTIRGAKISNEANKNIFDEMTYYFKNIFIKKINYEPINSVRLGYCLDELASQMEINHLVNIKRNFNRYFNQTTKCIFNPIIASLIESKIYEKNVNKKNILRKIRNDILENKKEAGEQYRKKILSVRKEIFGKIDVKSLEDLIHKIKLTPHIFLEKMLVMNSILEKNNSKIFQPICLGSKISNSYVSFTSSAIANIFMKGNKLDILKNINSKKDKLWENHFSIKFKGYKKYCFNHQISTDGHGISISIILKSEYVKHQSKLRNKAIASKKVKKEGPMTIRKEQIKNDIIVKKKEKDTLIKKQLSEKAKKKYAKLSSDEKEKQKMKIMLGKDFPYIEHAVKNKIICESLKKSFEKNKLVVGDPGKRTILRLKSSGIKSNDDDKRTNQQDFSYNNRRRVAQNKRLKSQKLIHNKKIKEKCSNNDTILKTEQTLVDFNSKSVDHSKFLKFVNRKNEVRKLILENNDYHKYLLKHKWHSYMNNSRHENLLKNELINHFGKDAVYVIGDWNSSSLPIKYMSTPGIGMRRLLRSIGKVFLIDEFRTSMYRQDNKERLKNLALKINNKKRELHSVLTYQMGNKRMGCINRDSNAVNNMLEIVKSLLDTTKRPDTFCRKKVADQRKQIKEKEPKKAQIVNQKNKIKKKELKKSQKINQKSFLSSNGEFAH